MSCLRVGQPEGWQRVEAEVGELEAAVTRGDVRDVTEVALEHGARRGRGDYLIKVVVMV